MTMTDGELDALEQQPELPEGVKRTIKALRTEVKALKGGTGKYAELEAKYQTLLKTSALKESLLAAGIKSEALAIVLPYVKENYEVEVVGDSVAIKTAEGSVAIGEAIKGIRDSELMSGFFKPVNTNTGSGTPSGAAENVRQLSRTEEAKRLWENTLKAGGSPEVAFQEIAKAGLSDVRF